MTTSRPSLPAAMAVALLLVLVELGAVVALAVGMIVEAVGGTAQTPGSTVVLAVIFLLLTVLLALACRALWLGQRWGRGPVITWQLLLLAIGVSQSATLVGWLVALLVVLPVVVAVGLLVPPSVAWTAPAGPPRR
ncbi:hypothetical protein [Georgenia sunbinii]|uniref:hypothetical protein n=1 Tax=Georgenia sunbinii TaxID=3117728 RepID=UPI002F26A07E